MQEEKAFFSDVGTANMYGSTDYSVLFTDCQSLQLLERKILQISSALQANLDAMNICESICNGVPPSAMGKTVSTEIQLCATQTRFYLDIVGRLLQQSHGAINLVGTNTGDSSQRYWSLAMI